MSVLGRLSSMQQFLGTRSNLLSNQYELSEATTKMNLGKRTLSAIEDPHATSSIVWKNSNIAKRSNAEDQKAIAVSELELAESSLVSIKEALDEIKADAVYAASDTSGELDRDNVASKMRSLGETIVKLSNSKVGEKYLFSGTQSDLKTIDYTANTVFANAQYKEGKVDLGERKVQGYTASVSLQEVYNSTESSAIIASSAPSAGVINGDIKLIINDGNGNIIDTGDISFAGDNTASSIVKINAAFNAAGGLGSIAIQDPAGYIKLDTALITNGVKNSEASITLKKGTNPLNVLNEINMKEGTTKGISGSLQNTLSKLEAAYKSNDSAAIRTVLVDLDAAIDRLITSEAKLGALVKNLEDSSIVDADIKNYLQIEKSSIEDMPITDAISDVTQAQAVVAATMQASSIVFQQNIFNFLDL
jgi:flagellin-like hook-associated protein FlgL